MFSAFTRAEIESIRSIVIMGQQQDDQLLSNCSSRPLSQTRSFIRRFKRVLLDSQASTVDLTKSANEQYVAIIAGVRVKRSSRRMTNSVSLANIASPLFNSDQTVPLKFQPRYGKVEFEPEPERPRAQPLPTRSRSISEGLVLPAVSLRKVESQIRILPESGPSIAQGCKNLGELEPGVLVAVLPSPGQNAVCGRVLGKRMIGREEHALVAFFQPGVPPCFAKPQQLIRLHRKLSETLSNPVTVDSVLDHVVRTSQALVVDAFPDVSKDLMFKSFPCAVQLALLNFAAKHRIPEDKLRLMLEAVQKMNQFKSQESIDLNARCVELVSTIVGALV